MYRKLAYTEALRNYSRIASRWQLISPDGIFYSLRVSGIPQLQFIPFVVINLSLGQLFRRFDPDLLKHLVYFFLQFLLPLLGLGSHISIRFKTLC